MKIKKEMIPKQDATLPSSRRKQFVDIFKNDFFLLVDICLFNQLFSIPLIVVLFLEYVSLSSVETYTFEKVFPIIFYMGLIAIIPFALRGLAKGASYGLLKKRIFNEGFMISSLFFKNIKNNFAHYFFSYLILGVGYFISSSGIIYFLYLDANSFIKGLGIGIFILSFVLRFVAVQYYLMLDNLYVLSFKDGVKNAYSFTFMTLLPSFVYIIMALIIPISLMVINYWVMIIVVCIYLLFYDGLMMLIANLYGYTKFDKYINKEHHQEYVNKGLLKEE